MNNFEKIAEQHFFNHNFKDALKYFNMQIQLDNSNEDINIKILIAEMALETPQEASALYDYYSILKKETPNEANSLIMELIKSNDEKNSNQINNMNTLINSINPKNKLPQDSIDYSDFLELIENRGSFKIAFEDIIFSKRLIIIEKDEFISFINMLLQNGFKDVALSYIENITEEFRYNKEIINLFNKIKGEM